MIPPLHVRRLDAVAVTIYFLGDLGIDDLQPHEVLTIAGNCQDGNARGIMGLLEEYSTFPKNKRPDGSAVHLYSRCSAPELDQLREKLEPNHLDQLVGLVTGYVEKLRALWRHTPGPKRKERPSDKEIVEAISKTGWQYTKAANSLGMSESRLSRVLKKDLSAMDVVKILKDMFAR